MFFIIAIAVWICALVIWWVCSNAFRHSDMDKLKSRLLGSNKAKKAKARRRGRHPDPSRGKGRAAGHPAAASATSCTPSSRKCWSRPGCAGARTGWSIPAWWLSWRAGRLAWVLLPGQFQKFAYLPGLLAGSFPLLYVMRKRTARMRRFEELFPDSLEFVARSMRAGHAFSVSLEMIHREFQEPLAGEFRRTFEEHNLGLPLDVALQKLAKRVPSLDVHFFVSAVLLQKRTGGNLAEILDKLAYVIRERFKLRGKIRAISAHGRMTGTALSCIPIGVAVIMFYVNPDYVRFFFLDDVGNIMLGCAIVLQLIGYAIMQKIVKIEV